MSTAAGIAVWGSLHRFFLQPFGFTECNSPFIAFHVKWPLRLLHHRQITSEQATEHQWMYYFRIITSTFITITITSSLLTRPVSGYMRNAVCNSI
jgi:hypothetical protein